MRRIARGRAAVTEVRALIAAERAALAASGRRKQREKKAIIEDDQPNLDTSVCAKSAFRLIHNSATVRIDCKKVDESTVLRPNVSTDDQEGLAEYVGTD